MRAVLQRVTRARVTVGVENPGSDNPGSDNPEGDTVGELDIPAGGHGLVALVGVTHEDTADDAARLADKIWRLRIFGGVDGGPERAAVDVDAPILVISQFTLYANTAKGRRPSWNAAAPGPVAEPLVDAVVEALREAGATVETGRFGAHMSVELVNDGPVTILLES